MARDDQPSPIRRLLMQWIMWVVLGLTVVAAAAVNQYKRQTLRPRLDEQVEFRGVSVRLPAGWVSLPGEGDENSIVRRNPQYGDVLVLSVRPRTLTEMTGLSRQGPGLRPVFLREIEVAGKLEPLMLQRWSSRSAETIAAMEVSRTLPRGRILSLSLVAAGADSEDLAPEINLLQRVAASIQVDPDY